MLASEQDSFSLASLASSLAVNCCYLKSSNAWGDQQSSVMVEFGQSWVHCRERIYKSGPQGPPLRMVFIFPCSNTLDSDKKTSYSLYSGWVGWPINWLIVLKQGNINKQTWKDSGRW